jgi:glycosyltransferase involved in cell wall biosynthesis
MEVSVVICTHNPRPRYLRRVLEALREQTLSTDRWQLLLIDNASEEPLTPEKWDLSWHPHSCHVREEELGLSTARLRGMREAKAEMLVFVDDDNVLASNYLQEAVRIKREWPMLGVWGSGAIIPEFEIPPAQYLQKYLSLLALREVKKPQWTNIIPCTGADPWGAGQCVRADVADAYCNHVETTRIRITGRKGAILSSGEDVELGFLACSIGLGVGIFPELKLTHIIPKERVDESYLVRLAEGIRRSHLLLEYKWQHIVPQSPLEGVLNLLRVVKNLVFQTGIRRRIYLADLRARYRARSIISKIH